MRTLKVGVLLTLGILPAKLWATLQYSYRDTLTYGLDFSTRLNGYHAQEEMLDFWLYDVTPSPELGPDLIIINAHGGITDMGAIPLSEITVVPDTLEWYNSNVLSEGHTYILRTREGHFAKLFVFRFVISSFPILIDWIYQDDGSKNLDISTSIDSETWGIVKDRYKGRDK